MMSWMLRPVVAAVDMCTDDPGVVRLAAAEAAGQGTPLHLVCMSGRPAGSRPGESRLRVVEEHPDLAVTTTWTGDDPVVALVEEGNRAALLVVARGTGPGNRDSLPVRVAARARCPVLVTPPGGYVRSHGPVVVGVKARARDTAAVALGLQRAARARVPVRVVHVWMNTPDMEYASVDPYVYDLAEAGRDADRLIATAVGDWDERYPQVRVERVPLYRTDVADALLDAVAGASLLVLGPPRHERAGTAALGPVSRALIDQAGCPVLLTQDVPVPVAASHAAAHRVGRPLPA